MSRSGRGWWGVVLVAVAASACVAPSSAADPTVLTVLLADDWASAPAVVEAVGDFEVEHPGVRVALRGVTFAQLEGSMVADRSGPREVDVSQWHAFAAGAQGYAQPVTARFERTFADGTFVPGAVEDVSWAGEVYGVPLDVNALALIVNTTALARLGHRLEDLRTWSGVRRVAEVASAAGLRFTHLPVSSWSLYGWLRSNGADLFDLAADGTPTLTFDAPRVIETFEFLGGLAREARLAVPANAVDSESDGFALFVDGHTLTVATGTWSVAELGKHPPGFDWTVVPMPAGPAVAEPHTVLGGSSLYVTEQADDPDLAFDLAAWLIRPEYSMRYARDDGRLPPQTALLADPFFDQDVYRTVVDVLPVADPMRLISFPRVHELYTQALFEILNDAVPPAEALSGLEDQAGAALAADLDGAR